MYLPSQLLAIIGRELMVISLKVLFNKQTLIFLLRTSAKFGDEAAFHAAVKAWLLPPPRDWSPTAA